MRLKVRSMGSLTQNRTALSGWVTTVPAAGVVRIRAVCAVSGAGQAMSTPNNPSQDTRDHAAKSLRPWQYRVGKSMAHPFIRARHSSTHLGVYDTPDDDSASTALSPVSTASAKTCLEREAALGLKFDGKDTDKIM